MRCEKGAIALKRRWKRISAGLLAALTLCLCPCFAGAAPPEDLPAVKNFQYATSGMCIEEFNRYQIKETVRGRFAWIELHNNDHYVLPLTDEDMASFSALVQALALTDWNGYHKSSAMYWTARASRCASNLRTEELSMPAAPTVFPEVIAKRPPRSETSLRN